MVQRVAAHSGNGCAAGPKLLQQWMQREQFQLQLVQHLLLVHHLLLQKDMHAGH